ncbi:hypothetical protein GCM10023151_10900 [Kangiella marina]|uniref:Uncharacterized protein n=2 Tax=Kangiella marina TaxID=1079178 RepID=A0ABP8IJ59_9GAMM
MEPSTADLIAYSHLFFACILLGWQSLQLKSGYLKLRQCSHYESYLNELFDNRTRNRPAQNASLLEVVRKQRKANNVIRGDAESYQQTHYTLLFFGLLTLFIGSLFLLLAQILKL